MINDLLLPNAITGFIILTLLLLSDDFTLNSMNIF